MYRSKAIAIYRRRGVILPGYQAEVAQWIADHGGEQ